MGVLTGCRRQERGRQERGAVEDRQDELDILRASRLRWTMLRPPRLVDGEPKGEVKVSFERPPSLQIIRADLARRVTEALTDESLVGRVPFVSN